MRKFEVVSKVFGAGILTLQGDFDWEFVANTPLFGTGYVLSGTWRILSAERPAEWHKEQRESQLASVMGIEDHEPDTDCAVEDPFLTPPGKWLTIVTDIGEVLGFEIVRDVQ